MPTRKQAKAGIKGGKLSYFKSTAFIVAGNQKQATSTAVHINTKAKNIVLTAPKKSSQRAFLNSTYA